MKKLSLTLFVAVGLMFSSVAQSLKINAEDAKIEFNFVDKSTTGTVEGLKAEVNFDISDLSNASISGSVDITTLTTSNKQRDKHLQASDMFDAANHPTMDFKSTSIEAQEDQFIMKGELTIKGTTKEVEIPFTYKDKTFEGKLVVFTNDFDVFSQKKREQSKVLVKITIPVQ